MTRDSHGAAVGPLRWGTTPYQLHARDYLGTQLGDRTPLTRRLKSPPRRVNRACTELAEAKIAHCVRQVVETAPPMTPEQLERLSLLFRGGAR